MPVFKYPSAALDERFRMVAGGGLLRLISAWGMDSWFSAEARDLLNRMLQVDPLRRPTSAEILQHVWLDGPGMPATLNHMAAPHVHADDAAAAAAAAHDGAGAGAVASSSGAAPADTGADEDADMDMDDDDSGNPPT